MAALTPCWECGWITPTEAALAMWRHRWTRPDGTLYPVPGGGAA